MRRSATLILGLALLLAPAGVDAQRGGGRSQDAGQGWPAPTAGLRVGYDDNSTGTVLGAQFRIAALPSGMVELVPNADVTFLPGLKEYQYGVDAVLVSGGRRGGIFAGGGIAWRNTIYEGPGRETRMAPVLVVGARSSALFGAPFGTQIEMRWTYPDGVFKPRALTFGVNFPLGGGDGRRR